MLPHPGGGGETYVDLLSEIGSYSTRKIFISDNARPDVGVLAGSLRAQLAARRFDLLHVHGEVAAGLCLAALALRPSVVTIHGLHLVRRAQSWRYVAAVGNLRLVNRFASATICVAESEAAEAEAAIGHDARVDLIRNGVDLPPEPTDDERRSARDALGLSQTDTVGIYVAALDPHKSPLVAAEAAVEARRSGVGVQVLFAGEGRLRPQLESLARETTAVQVLGLRNDVPRLLAAADFFVLPSTREGLSFALLEAMSSALAPVVADAPGNRDAVADAGFLVPPGDVAGFAAAFTRLAADPNERRVVGMRARERVAQRFSRAEMVERTCAVYARVLGL